MSALDIGWSSNLSYTCIKLKSGACWRINQPRNPTAAETKLLVEDFASQHIFTDLTAHRSVCVIIDHSVQPYTLHCNVQMIGLLSASRGHHAHITTIDTAFDAPETHRLIVSVLTFGFREHSNSSPVN